MRYSILILALMLLLLGACTSNQTFLNTDQKLAKADELYEQGKYSRAAELYGEVYFERSSAYSAHALMRQGDSYFKINKFADARIAYQEFADVFSSHPDASKAVFRAAQCLYEESLPPQYDQTETRHAIDAFREFIAKYPHDPLYDEAVAYIQKAQYKLIEKKFKTGYIYYKMKDYSSALLYFNEIAELGNNDRLDRESLYYSALILHKQELHDQARDKYEELVRKYPGSKESKKLAKYFK
jgi:outer membrane protein assembly factor BamD